ncbi:MAG: hypothetical protein WA003_15820 [Desulfuromonadaceae bacterium]
MRDQQQRVVIGETQTESQNATTITEFWSSIPSGTTSGTLSPEAGHEFVANQWEDGVDTIVTGITGGVPNLQPVYEADGVTLVTATLNTVSGAWAFSGEPAGADPVALVTAQRAIGADATTHGALINSATEKTALAAGDKISLRDVVTGDMQWVSPANLAAYRDVEPTPVAITDVIGPNTNPAVLFTENIDVATVTTSGAGYGASEMRDLTTGAWVAGATTTSDNLTFTFEQTAPFTVGRNYRWYLSQDITGSAAGLKYDGTDRTFTCVVTWDFSDYTTYTEVDVPGRLTVAATSITFTGVTRDESVYIYHDVGASGLAGAFTHYFDVYGDETGSGSIAAWGVADGIGDLGTVDNAGKVVAVNVAYSGNNLITSLTEVIAGSATIGTPSPIDITDAAWVYFRIVHNPAGGTVGTLTLTAYSDAGKTTPIGSPTVLTLTQALTYPYFYTFSSNDVNNAALVSSGVIANHAVVA